MWLAQLPAFLTDADSAALQQKMAGATRECMLREMAEALEALSAERPLVFVLEDLHWSDASTIDLLSMLAGRREAARLMMMGTVRPVELIVNNHPFKAVKHELAARGRATELALRRLDAAAVQHYVIQRLADPVVAATVAEIVYRRTEGHPLFMVQVTEYLQQQDALTVEAGASGLPLGIQELIEAQVGRLTEGEQQVLDAGSVAGVEFSVASIAAGVSLAVEGIETICEQLVRRDQFIEERGLKTWPDGTVSGHYGFRHALYQEALYQRLSASRRARLHRQIGEREEAAYGERTREIAAELAVHFERGLETQQAVHYRWCAAEGALQRNAYPEASLHCQAGLAMLLGMPETSARAQQELNLQMILGVVLSATKGYAAPEVEQAYLRAYALCEQIGESAQLSQVLRGLVIFYTVRADFPRARELAEHSAALPPGDPVRARPSCYSALARSLGAVAARFSRPSVATQPRSGAVSARA
jgi:predicted ATPase